MFYLNTNSPYKSFQMALNDDIYVDKTLLISAVSRRIARENRFICITRPRRFGKSINANMLAAYYTVGFDSGSLFKNCLIADRLDYGSHINQHNVIFIDLSRLPRACNSCQEYISEIENNIIDDLYTAYPDLRDKRFSNIDQLFSMTGNQFIFILDEWDSVFYKDFMTKSDRELYLRFLENLLKGQSYVDLAYMTGVLPIAKYSSGSALNMFDEYSFLDDDLYDSYFGFTEEEVRELCTSYTKPSFEEIKYWYDGYYMTDGSSLFNPRSVTSALTRGRCRNYWTETGPMSEISDCIEHNVDAVREDIVQLVSGIPVEISLSGYSASDLKLDSRDEILSAMVVYGFLSYHDQILRIPNHELMQKFQTVLNRKSLGAVKEIVDRSEEMLEATLRQDCEKVASILEYVHDKEIPFLQYNDENSLSCVITLCYLYARNFYRIEREEKSGKGYCDYLFYPLKNSRPAIVLELKYGKKCQEALDQIKRKNYIDKVHDCREILLVGINYSPSIDKHHECIIEKLNP